MVNATHPEHVVIEYPSTYLTILKEQLEIRAREHGEAWLTPQEAAWIRANGLNLLDRYPVMGKTLAGKAREQAAQN
jgi:hypothetical protein